MISLEKSFKKKGYVIIDIKDKSFFKKIYEEINKSKILSINNNKKFSSKCIELQNKIYKKKHHIKVLKDNFSDIKKAIGVKSKKELAITTFVHFRGVKKKTKKGKRKFVGLHRETFYSDFDYTKHQINISLPIQNYNKNNSLKIISGSHKIPDKKILTKKLSSFESGVKKFSVDHRLGLPYNPKVIVSGINTSKASRTNLKTGQIILFSAMLIHGNGSNNYLKPRFSIDFGLIKKKYLKGKKIKDHSLISYAKNKKYWSSL